MPSLYSGFAAGFLTAAAIGAGFAGTYMDFIGAERSQVAPVRSLATAASNRQLAAGQPGGGATTSGVAHPAVAPDDMLDRRVEPPERSSSSEPSLPPSASTPRTSGSPATGQATDVRNAEQKSQPAVTAKSKKKIVRRRDRQGDPGRAYADGPYYRNDFRYSTRDGPGGWR